MSGRDAWLADGTKVSAALPDDDFDDWGTAKLAGLVFTSIHMKVILKTSAAVNPIDAGAIVFNAIVQDNLDGLIKANSLVKVNCI